MRIDSKIYPSSNDYGIPDLIFTREDTSPPLDGPLAVWGTISRKSSFGGTWAFYTDDYKFTGLQDDPLPPILSGAAGLIEPNFSILNETPDAVASYLIYLKRWIARSWQEACLTINLWVDLAVAPAHAKKSLLGVPSGWQRYATTARDFEIDLLDQDLNTATVGSAGNPFTLIVYGGGAEVKDWCRNRGCVIHVPHVRSKAYKPGQGSRRRLAMKQSEIENG